MPYILRIISGPTYILYSKYSRYSLFTLCNVNVPVGSQIWQRTEKWILFVQWELIKYRRDDDDKVSTDTASVVTNTAWRHTAKYRHTHHHRHHHHFHSVHYRQKHTDTITYTGQPVIFHCSSHRHYTDNTLLYPAFHLQINIYIYRERQKSKNDSLTIC